MTEESSMLQSMESQRVDHDLVTEQQQFHYNSWIAFHILGYLIKLIQINTLEVQFSSVVQSCLTLQPHDLQHSRPPCSSPTPRVYSNSCPLNQWCHPTISSSVVSFSSRLQPFPASGSFQMSQFFASGGQSIGVSASSSVLSMNIQDLFPLGWTSWISCYPRNSQESSSTPQFKSISSSVLNFLYSPNLTTKV